LKRKIIPYKIEVSSAVSGTLKRKPLRSKLTKIVQGKILNQQNRKTTVKVSINCE